MNVNLLRRHLLELPYFRSILRTVEAEIMGGLDLPAPTLDLGSGDGHFASVAFSKRIDVGLDPDLPSLRESQPRSAYRLLVAAGGSQIPFRTGSFSSAISNSVLEHIPGLEDVLAETGRVLRPGAPFAITVPNPDYRDKLQGPEILHRLGMNGLGESYRAWFMKMSRTWNLLDEEGWRRLFSKAGFEIEKTYRYFPPASLHALEWGHYFGAPCLLPKLFVKRWIFIRSAWNVWLTEKIIQGYARFRIDEDGTYTFYLARRRPN
jgi:SAM-dependent methyltransferase